MSITVKRKRGRPRLDEPREIKDFDNNLIQEFKNFPVFYDRLHPQHRNREYTDRIWQRIAQNLNVTTNLAKTRMLQLRNRFNLEKRRVEAMKDQDQSSVSQWSLYERLSFLSNYVKTRRPYSLATGYNPKVNSTASSSFGEEEDDGDDVETSNTQDNAFNSNQMLTNVNLLANKQTADAFSANQNQLSNTNMDHVQRTIIQPLEGNKDFATRYKAFGQFLASSLIEMNDIQALNLVEKFTIDIVKYLKTEERRNSFINMSQKNNVEGDDENSLTVY